MPFDGSVHTSVHLALPFTREDYFKLVDTTGKAVREDKKGFISGQIPTVLTRLGIESKEWIEQIQQFGRFFSHCAWTVTHMRAFARRHDKKWTAGIGKAGKVFREVA